MVKFFEPHPNFGTKNHRLNPSQYQKSPYYWWWEFLRRNKEYLATCEKDGIGKYTDLYADFGDVRDVEFRVWWRNKGVKLFAEQKSDLVFKEISNKEEVPNQWNKNDLLFLQVPLTYDKKSLKKYFNKLLMDKPGRLRGRPTKESKKSTAKYLLNGAYTIANLRICLEVYDLYVTTRKGPNKMKLWEIGFEKKLVKSESMPDPKDDSVDRLIKRNLSAATVSRYVKQAKTRIENVALGKFPI